MGLDEAKEIIRGADQAGSPVRYSEIDSAAVYEEGWIHLGEDHYLNVTANQVAGPGGGAARVLVEVPPELLDRIAKGAMDYDIALEWDRQAAAEPSSGHLQEGSPPEASPDSGNIGRLARERKCACDT